ncbi:MAG: hypothetical protein ACNI3A_19290 [Desulfovibrio sp.]|uniref:hypothetical protein n=1 Tax=Desulfovibrio sp. 7SRBS1 TaxID=3378064 RepID=UPI003B3DDF50
MMNLVSKLLRRIFLSLLVLTLFFITSTAGRHVCHAQRLVVPISIHPATAQEYMKFMAAHPEGPAGIEHVGNNTLTRGIAEVLIIAKALQLGGIDPTFEYKFVPNARRETMEVANGMAVICSQQFNKYTMLTPGYKESLYLSSPIIRFGEFQKGFYCLPDNKKVLEARTVQELNAAGTGLVGRHWNNDHQVLTAMGLTDIETAPTFKALFEMLRVGRGDWIPLEFSNAKDLSRIQFGVRVVPVPGIKFSLLESRHFLVSRTHRLGPEVFAALEKGIAQLRQRGFIRETLSAAGFFNEQTKSWRMLNQAEVDAGQQD